MKCPRCQHDNETGAKFCEDCATPLARPCAQCGRSLSATAKFCPECAHPTGLSAAPSPARRFDFPESYTPKRLAEKILTSKSALEGGLRRGAAGCRPRRRGTVMRSRTPVGRRDARTPKQNVAVGDSWTPHLEQVRTRGAAHSSQNLAVGRFSCWHRKHFIRLASTHSASPVTK
jgi:hypothetical protein